MSNARPSGGAGATGRPHAHKPHSSSMGSEGDVAGLLHLLEGVVPRGRLGPQALPAGERPPGLPPPGLPHSEPDASLCSSPAPSVAAAPAVGSGAFTIA